MDKKVLNALGILESLKLPALWELYSLAINEQTKCPNKKWLIGKIHAAVVAEKRSPVKSSEKAEADDSADTKARQVIPLRISPEVLAKIDAARERLGIKNRSVLIFNALYEFFKRAGETEVADLLAAE